MGYHNKNSDIAQRLAQSTLTPGEWKVPLDIRHSEHHAVTVGGHPVVITGPGDDDQSKNVAQKLAASDVFARAVKAAGHEGDISTCITHGSEIKWKDQSSVLCLKEAGKVEDGSEKSSDVMVILPQEKTPGLAVLMATQNETVKAIDPSAPDIGQNTHELRADEKEIIERAVRASISFGTGLSTHVKEQLEMNELDFNPQHEKYMLDIYQAQLDYER
jgi:hypothetical protein